MSMINNNNAILTVALISDLHAEDEDSLNTLQLSLQNIAKIDQVNALLIPGDLADYIDKRNQCFDIIEQEFPKKYFSNVAIILGNHDIRWYNETNEIDPNVLINYKKRNSKFSPIVYPETHCFDHWINGYHFISLNSDKGLKDMCELSDKTLQWLEETLAVDADINKPIFIISHQPLNNTHWRAGLYGGFGAQDQKVKEILSYYPQAILINGHIHNGFGVIEFIQRQFATLIEAPSLTKTQNGLGDKGTGWLIKICHDKIIFEAWNFVNSKIYDEYSHDLLLPSLAVLTAELKKSALDSKKQELIVQAEKIMAHKYENDIPDGDSTTWGQAHYDVDKIYDQSRWENINDLREKIIAMLDADKDNVPSSGPSVTSYFSSNSAELLYIEQKVPTEGDREHIYWSGCNFFFGERGAYAGIQHQADKVIEGVPFIYNNICSIWDLKELDPELPTEVKLTYGHEGLHWSHFGGEGTGLHTSHPMPWYTDQWYATVIRRWYIPGEKVTRMAMFMYSYYEQKWTHYMSAAVPGIDIPLTGNSCTGFLERFAGKELGYYGIYGQHFRMNKDGSWQKPIFYEANAGGNPNYWKAELYQNTNIKLIAGGIYDNNQNSIKFYPNQFDTKPKPVIPAVIENISASYNQINNYSVIVEWQNSDKTPPQLSYNIKIYRDSINGKLIAQQHGISPEERKIVLKTGALSPGKYYATIQIEDIFNNRSNTAHTKFII
ncbi:metallophosphoesterase family protein [Candidatus Arsenophonus nilaparvatae]|uniref:metallophosphoesterase family protein n=2 Tax=Candidatus Arsenophonus nilaparvatae TaxID=1247023 RepID=UPI00068BAC5F|nr:metallophosphoesterase [Candidatus Arsenophonus nilaparvatae]